MKTKALVIAVTLLVTLLSSKKSNAQVTGYCWGPMNLYGISLCYAVIVYQCGWTSCYRYDVADPRNCLPVPYTPFCH